MSANIILCETGYYRSSCVECQRRKQKVRLFLLDPALQRFSRLSAGPMEPNPAAFVFLFVHLTDNARSSPMFMRAVAEIAYELVADFLVPRLV